MKRIKNDFLLKNQKITKDWYFRNSTNYDLAKCSLCGIRKDAHGILESKDDYKFVCPNTFIVVGKNNKVSVELKNGSKYFCHSGSFDYPNSLIKY